MGFDTETVRDFSNANMMYSTQIFYKPSYASEHKSIIDIKPCRGVKRLNDFPKKSFIFAHNLEFDLTNILGEDLKIFNRGWSLKGWKGFFVFGQGASLARFTNKNTGQDLKFIDTSNYYKGSLKYIAKAELPLNKLEQPKYLGWREPFKEEMEYFLKYAERDAELTYLLGLNIYIDYWQIAKAWSYTKAGLAVKSFRSEFLPKPFYLPDKTDISFIWNCYNGARFESYGRGYFKNVKIFDINSLYPYAATFPMPFSSNKLEKISLEEYEKNKENFIGWCKISGRYKKKMTYPLIPQRTNKLYFPLEFYNSYLTTYELAPALNDIEIDKSEIRGFFPTRYDIDHPIKNYVNFYYSQKEKLDKIKEKRPLTEAERQARDYYKAMINHLYGKTGEKHNQLNKYGKKVLVSGKFFNPFVCSLITGKSRAILGEYVNKYNALYCDTDSVATTKTIPTSSKLGDFKLEAKGDMLLIRPKLYFCFKKGKVSKFARHSFRLKFKKTKDKKDYGRKLYEYITQFKHKKLIPYQIEKISKFKESIRRDINFLTNLTVKIKVKMHEDNRREYLKHFATLAEMEENNTLSMPVEKAKFR